MKICQVDTCVISDVLENEIALNSFKKFIVESNSLIGLSVYAFYELSKSEKIYNKFKIIFPPKRIVLLKTSSMLLEDEMEAYLSLKKIEPIFIPPTENFDLINSVFSSEKMRNNYIKLDNDKNIVLTHILDLKRSFPPKKNGKYTKEDRIEFVKKVTIQQFERFNREWFLHRKNENFNYSAFKSLTGQLYITFFKFYILKDRKPKVSDIIDITMSASFPYVDFILTEKNLAYDIKQMQKQNLHFENTVVYTLEDIKKNYA